MLPTPVDQPGVLFVDDEPDLLAGLRSALRRQRRDFRLHFAVGGEAAIEVLEREPIDLIVSDMRMPGMNGVELLNRVKRDHPAVVRFILSGEAEEHLVVGAVGVAHRWLTKPCDREDVLAAIIDGTNHQRALHDRDAAAALASVDALATPPQLYVQLQELIADPDVRLAAVAELIGRDPAIAAKVLQWANSAFAAARRCEDVPGAIARIGLDAVSQLVLVAEVFRRTETSEAVPGFGADLLQLHAEHIADLAGRLAPGDPIARLGGLLSHVGLLLESAHLPGRLDAAYGFATTNGIRLVDAERELFGSTHPELGCFLLSLWGLPTDLAQAVRTSHERPDATSHPANVVRIARLLALNAQHATAIGSPHVDLVDETLATMLDAARRPEHERTPS